MDWRITIGMLTSTYSGNVVAIGQSSSQTPVPIYSTGLTRGPKRSTGTEAGSRY